MMLRRSIPGKIEFIDLGPGVAARSGVRGTFLVPERAPGPNDSDEALARKERDAAYHRAWRAANREHVRAYDRKRKGRA